MQNLKPKNYHRIYWGWFATLLVVSIIGNLLPAFIKEKPELAELSTAYLFLLVIVIVLFINTTHKALKAAGKNYGWLVGLLVLVPYGFWVAILIARHHLMKANLWGAGKAFEVDENAGLPMHKKKLNIWQTILLLAIGMVVMFLVAMGIGALFF